MKSLTITLKTSSKQEITLSVWAFFAVVGISSLSDKINKCTLNYAPKSAVSPCIITIKNDLVVNSIKIILTTI